METADGEPLDWKFSQVFGEKTSQESTEADIVSALSFDETGDLLAAGDRGGRLVIFQRDGVNTKKKNNLPKYKFYVEFQSHEPEFDYLKSLEIEEKINKIKWVPKTNHADFLLSTNDKTVKLWKIFEKNIKAISLMDHHSGTSLSVPQLSCRESVVSALPRRIYSNAHAYHINSIALNSDGETYISSDDLRINMWNLEINNQSFNIVDIKPENMEELSEVITSAEFHPSHCNIFIFSSSKGSIKLGDLRDSALCDNHAKIFEEAEDPANRSFFSEIISSISDIKFSNDGRYILSRDYLTLKVWDINMESKPVKTISIHDYLRSKLCDLYENDCIFDKFECVWNHNDSHVITGSYDNLFHIYDSKTAQDTLIKASKSSLNPSKHKKRKGKHKKHDQIDTESIDYNKKILNLACHPRENTVAISACNNLYIYSAAGGSSH